MVKAAKKQRGVCSEENVSTPEPETTRRGGRPRRLQRSKPEEEEEKEKDKPSNKTASSEDDSVVVLDDLILGEDAVKKGEVAKCLAE